MPRLALPLILALLAFHLPLAKASVLLAAVDPGEQAGPGFVLSLVLLYEDDTVSSFQAVKLWGDGVLAAAVEKDAGGSYLVTVLIGPGGGVEWRQEIFVDDPEASVSSIDIYGDRAFISLFLPSKNVLRVYGIASDGSLAETLEYPLPPNVTIVDALLGPGKAVFVAGGAYWLVYGTDYYVAKVTESGVEWRILYGSDGDDILYSVRETGEGFLLFTGNNGSSSYVLLASTAGRVLVNKTVEGFQAYSAVEEDDTIVLAGSLGGNASIALISLGDVGGEPLFVDTGVPGVAVDVVVATRGLAASVIAVPPETGLPPVIALIDPVSAEVVKLYNSSLDPGVLPVEVDSLGNLILVAAGGGRGVVAVYSIDTPPSTGATEEPVTGTQGYEPPGIVGSLLYSPALTVALIAALSLTIAGIIRNRRKRGTS